MAETSLFALDPPVPHLHPPLQTPHHHGEAGVAKSASLVQWSQVACPLCLIISAIKTMFLTLAGLQDLGSLAPPGTKCNQGVGLVG